MTTSAQYDKRLDAAPGGGLTVARRLGLAADWTAANPVLAMGEEGYETDTKKLKIGDGVTAWSALSYRVSDPSNVNIGGGTISMRVGGTFRTVRKMAAAAAAADRGNALMNAPLIAVSAWVASTAYQVGDVVSNGGSQYICSTAGTSAATGGPSGTALTPITDNTATWFFYGVPRTANTADAPTLSYGALPGGLTVRYAAVAQAAAFFYSGGVPTASGNGYAFPSAYQVTGGNVPGQTAYTTMSPSATFVTDAPKIAIGGIGPLYNNVVWRIEIDDAPLSDSAIHPSATVNPGAIILDWTGKARKARKIRVWCPANVTFDGVYVSPQDKVWAPSNPNRYRLMAQGDSLTQGGNGTPWIPGLDWPKQIGALLGCDDVWNVAVGGTGYLNNAGTKAVIGDATRLLDVTNNAPDVLILAGNHNDAGTYSNAQQQAAILSYLQAVRAALPNTIILMCGPNPEASGPSANMTAAEANCLAAYNSFSDPLSAFVPIINDGAGSWMTGTGKVTAQTGTGNSDIYTSSDGVHPTQIGVDYLARRYAQAVRSALNF